MNKISQCTIIFSVLVISLFFIATIVFNTPIIGKEIEYPITVPPVTQDFIKQEKGKPLQLTYGKVTLHIPEKYHPQKITKDTASIIFSLVWPELDAIDKPAQHQYGFSISIYPKHSNLLHQHTKYSQYLINNGYLLRDSIEYPLLKEYWNESKRDSFYFIVDYQPDVLNKIITCSPGYRNELVFRGSAIINVGDTFCSTYGVIADTLAVRIRFDTRLLPEAIDFHQRIDQLIASFIVYHLREP